MRGSRVLVLVLMALAVLLPAACWAQAREREREKQTERSKTTSGGGTSSTSSDEEDGDDSGDTSGLEGIDSALIRALLPPYWSVFSGRRSQTSWSALYPLSNKPVLRVGLLSFQDTGARLSSVRRTFWGVERGWGFAQERLRFSLGAFQEFSQGSRGTLLSAGFSLPLSETELTLGWQHFVRERKTLPMLGVRMRLF
jgi:hypothetical protein